MNGNGRSAALRILFMAALLATADAGQASDAAFGSQDVGRDFSDTVEIGNNSGASSPTTRSGSTK